MPVGAGTVRTKITVEGVDEVNRRLKNIEGAFDALSGGVQGTAGALRKFGPWVAAVVAGLGAAKVAFDAITAATQRVGEGLLALAERGGAASAIGIAFERIASPDLLSRMQEVSGGMVSSIDLMTNATRSLRAEIINEDTLVEWTGRVVRAAQDMGVEVPRALEMMSDALVGGGLDPLEDLGISVTAIEDVLDRSGVTAETMQGRITALTMAMDQLNGDMAGTSNSAVNLGGSITQISTVINEFINSVTRTFVQNDQLIEFFGRLRTAIEATLPSSGDWSETLVNGTVAVIDVFTTFMGAAIPVIRVMTRLGQVALVLASVAGLGMLDDEVASVNRALSSLDGVLEDVGTTMTALRRTTDEYVESLLRMREELHQGEGEFDLQTRAMHRERQALGAAREEMIRTSAAVQELNRAAREAEEPRETAAERLRRITREGDAEKGRLDAIRGKTEQLREAEQRRREQHRQAAAERLQALEAEKRLYDEVTRSIQEQSDRLKELAEARAAKDREEQEIELERLNRIKEMQDALDAKNEERRQNEADAAKQRATLAQRALDAEEARVAKIYSDTNKMIDGVQGLFSGVLSIMEATGASAEAQKKAQGGFIIAYSSVKAILELAEAIGSFAKQDYVAGAQHLLSMGAYIAAAAAAAAQLGGGAANAGPTTSAAAFTPTEPPPPSESDEGRGTVIVNNYSLGRSNGDLGGQLDRAQWERRRQGLPSPTPLGISYGG